MSPNFPIRKNRNYDLELREMGISGIGIVWIIADESAEKNFGFARGEG